MKPPEEGDGDLEQINRRQLIACAPWSGKTKSLGRRLTSGALNFVGDGITLS